MRITLARWAWKGNPMFGRFGGGWNWNLGIMIGGLGVMAPERRSEIVQLGLKSIVAGTLATLMTGSIVGIFLT